MHFINEHNKNAFAAVKSIPYVSLVTNSVTHSECFFKYFHYKNNKRKLQMALTNVKKLNIKIKTFAYETKKINVKKDNLM